MTRIAFTIAAAVFASTSCTAVAAAREIVGVRDFQIVSRLTGSPSQNQTTSVGIGGTDLGHMVTHNGRTYFLFGDTFSGEAPYSGGGNWRHNVMAWSTDTLPSDGIRFDGWLTNSSGMAKQVIRSGIGNPITEIPTGAISQNGHIYAWYMAVNWWGPPGQWSINRAGLARWKEGDSEFTNVEQFSFSGSSNFAMVAASRRSPSENVPSDDHTYLWGTPAGRFGGVKLARVAPDQIENLSAYRFFDGTVNGAPQWTSNENEADQIVPATVGEMSVMYNEFLGAWTMLYFNEVAAAFQIRQSPTPWGEWSAPIEVAHSRQAPGGLYAPYMNPLMVENGGETLYFTMSLWNPYDVYLAKVTLESVPEPSSAWIAVGLLVAASARRRRHVKHVTSQTRSITIVIPSWRRAAVPAPYARPVGLSKPPELSGTVSASMLMIRRSSFSLGLGRVRLGSVCQTFTLRVRAAHPCAYDGSICKRRGSRACRFSA